jgi:hypothetical protein
MYFNSKNEKKLIEMLSYYYSFLLLLFESIIFVGLGLNSQTLPTQKLEIFLHLQK